MTSRKQTIDGLTEDPLADTRLLVERQGCDVVLTTMFRTPAAAQVWYERVTDLLNTGEDVAITLRGARRVKEDEAT
jgi:hypothetical protein